MKSILIYVITVLASFSPVELLAQTPNNEKPFDCEFIDEATGKPIRIHEKLGRLYFEQEGSGKEWLRYHAITERKSKIFGYPGQSSVRIQTCVGDILFKRDARGCLAPVLQVTGKYMGRKMGAVHQCGFNRAGKFDFARSMFSVDLLPEKESGPSNSRPPPEGKYNHWQFSRYSDTIENESSKSDAEIEKIRSGKDPIRENSFVENKGPKATFYVCRDQNAALPLFFEFEEAARRSKKCKVHLGLRPLPTYTRPNSDPVQ